MEGLTGIEPAAPVIGLERMGGQWSALIRMSDSSAFGSDVVIDSASIDDIVIHFASAQKEVAA